MCLPLVEDRVMPPLMNNGHRRLGRIASRHRCIVEEWVEDERGSDGELTVVRGNSRAVAVHIGEGWREVRERETLGGWLNKDQVRRTMFIRM